MKLCVVGNSHAAALKSALAVDAAAVGVHADFFAMPGGSGPHLHARDGRLFPSSVMREKLFTTVAHAAEEGLDLGAFDAVMICAAGLPSHRNSDANHVLNRLALAALAHDAVGDRQPVSEAVMLRTMETVLHASPNFEAIRLVRSVYSGPIIVQVCPMPTRAIAAYKVEGERGSNLAAQYGDRVWSFLSWYYREQSRLISAFAQLLDARTIPLEETFLGTGFTPGKYGTPDPWHMNTAYGRLVLKGALAALAPTSSA